MRGCLSFIIGIILGAILIVALEVLVVAPPALLPPSPTNADLTIRFSDALLTRELQAQLGQPQGNPSIQGLAVHTDAGQTIILTGTAAISGTSPKIPMRLTLRPVVAQNRVSIQIVQAEIGNLKLPGSFFSSVEATINQELNRTLANQQYRVVGVATTVDGLVVDVDLNQ